MSGRWKIVHSSADGKKWFTVVDVVYNQVAATFPYKNEIDKPAANGHARMRCYELEQQTERSK